MNPCHGILTGNRSKHNQNKSPALENGHSDVRHSRTQGQTILRVVMVDKEIAEQETETKVHRKLD